jgi:hypothetical protein
MQCSSISERILLFRKFSALCVLCSVLCALCSRESDTEHWLYDADRENKSTRRKICLSVSLTTTNVTCTDVGSNSGLHLNSIQNAVATDRTQSVAITDTARLKMFG